MIENHNLHLMNGSEICEGLKTRQESNKKSVIDNVMVGKEEQGKGKIVFSDHNNIKLSIATHMY